MATRPVNRPLSPHLQIWRWGPHMLVSILHRATGTAMALAGTIGFVWWLAAQATGPAAYATWLWFFTELAGGAIGYVVAIGLSWAFFQHMSSGVRHWILDVGAGYELKANKTGAMVTMVVSVVLTIVFWAYILGVK